MRNLRCEISEPVLKNIKSEISESDPTNLRSETSYLEVRSQISYVVARQTLK